MKIAVDSENPFSWTVEIAADVVPGSVRTSAQVFTSPLASLTRALERLMREPHGCFEQTSSTNYPLTMAQQYFMTHSGVDPKIIEGSSSLLAKGYKRLISFECKKKGFEWFGQDPGHEALSAYGLMELTDMSKVHRVDLEMIERTRKWLLASRDGKGNFKRERRALHTWISDPECSNGYIIWSLLECGERVENLRKEISRFLFLVAAVPGKYTAPASRSYLYYTDELKHWTTPLSVEVLPTGAASEPQPIK